MFCITYPYSGNLVTERALGCLDWDSELRGALWALGSESIDVEASALFVGSYVVEQRGSVLKHKEKNKTKQQPNKPRGMKQAGRLDHRLERYSLL